MKHHLAAALVLAAASLAAAQPDAPAQYAAEVAAHAEADHMRSYHDLLAAEPHIAGTDGDARTIQRIEELFRSFGLSVERQPIWVYLATPVDASVRVLPAGETPIDLALKEAPLAEDEWTRNDELPIGFSAYSGSGTATGEVVYANYGRLEDFQQLKALGVDCTGKIVIARFGGNYRGYKAKFAEEAGAAGLIIYTDPADSGYARGIPYPEGGYANGGSIQRGSLATLEYSGDPLTPFTEATADADRLDPDAVALPKIPVQPIGWDAASEIIGRMKGASVPTGWQGGLPAAYRLTGGSDLRVEISVTQERRLVETANVIGELRGTTFPDEIIILGCHHDSWGYGASDPMAGMICLLEAARCFGALAGEGWRPARTIRFAAWAAEEHGIIGSTEYAEANADELIRGGVAYINLDMAAMGPNFSAAGTPTLARVLAEAASAVPQCRDASTTVLREWGGKAAAESGAYPRLGDLGGGSDHVAFNCYLAVPSVGLHASGSPGTSYHSNYDTLAWYRKVVGEDYEPALMVARMAVGVAARLAEADILPFEPAAYAEHTARHIADLEARANGMETAPLARVRIAAEAFGRRAAPVMERLANADLAAAEVRAVNANLLAIERSWIDGFDTGRSWFRSGYASSDQSSGYAAWMLPALRHAVELGDADLLDERSRAYERYFTRAGRLIDAIDAIIE